MPAFAGIYELAEASRYLYVTTPQKPPPYSTVRGWVIRGLPTPERRLPKQRGLLLTFEELVSLRMVLALRIAGFSLQHVRKVHTWLQDTTHYPRPFALKDLWVSETDIFAKMEGRLLSASKKGQYPMEFVKDWLHHLRRPTNGSLDMAFQRVDGNEVAVTWSPQLHIMLNPLMQFGAPCIEGTRIPTKSIWSMILGGDKPQTLARDYGVPLDKVQSALDWEKKIANLAA